MKYKHHSKLKELLFSRISNQNNLERIANRHRLLEHARNDYSGKAIYAKRYDRNYVKK